MSVLYEKHDLANHRSHENPLSMSDLFVAREGIKACGKWTQLNILANYLRGNAKDVAVTREPG
jgi:hypothetical protein